jgi:hypothetical protein
MYNAENLQEKWAPVLNHEGLNDIKDPYRKSVTAILLENQERALAEERAVLTEAPTNVGPINTPTTNSGAVAGFDPILISLIRRAMPKLIAYDIAGVQPMTGPTGLIFAMRSRYTNQSGNEAFFDEPDAQFSGTDGATPPTATTEKNPGLINDATGGGTTATNYDLASSKFTTSEQEALGDGASTAFMEMAFSIDKIAVEAKGRALRADYSVELAQDLKAIHGLDAESELANILSTEILAEINREVVRTVYRGAKPGAQANVANAGVFDLDVDSNGRWSVEKFKGLLFQIERDANAIAQETRRGKGNIIITSADVASALAMSGVLDYDSGISGAVGGIGEIDDTGNTFVGTLNGRFKVYIDPYSANVSDSQYYVVGYKGTNAYDAGLFYCPYVPLQMYRAIGQDTFQPRIGFKTRYGMVLNPFAKGLAALSDSDPQAAGNLNSNAYYRRVRVANLM